jgi:hypothetical protein
VAVGQPFDGETVDVVVVFVKTPVHMQRYLLMSKTEPLGHVPHCLMLMM